MSRGGGNPPGISASESLRHLDRTIIPNVSGVERRGRLEEKYVGFRSCHRLVVDASRNDEELSFIELDDSVTKVDR